MSALTVLGLLCLSLAAGLCDSLPDQQVVLERGNCPMFWYSFNGRCYRFFATLSNWGDAELHCVSEGGNLASVHSSQERTFIATLVKNYHPAGHWTWIGLTDIHVESKWMWSDGTKVDTSLWNGGTGGTTQNCGEVHGASWDDYPCSYARPFVCASRVL